jgi:hypothetical protein
VSLRDIHAGFSWVPIVSNAVAGLWALGAHWYLPLRRRALWWFTAAAQLTVVIQVVLGVAVVRRTGVELPRFHAFYGFVALVSVGIIYSYRTQLRHRLYLLYGLGGLFVMGLGIRAMMLSHTLR